MGEVTILKIGKNVIVPIQTELHDHVAGKLQADILKRIEKTAAEGLIIDVSAVSIIDSFLGRLLVETAKMAKLMGTETVLSGMKKEVVLTLIHLGLTMKDLHTALNIEDGLSLLESLTRRTHEKNRK
jgi:rsbT antagonist protein RsbS